MRSGSACVSWMLIHAVWLSVCTDVSAQTVSVEAIGSATVGRLVEGERAFSNRDYQWENVPDEISGWDFTRLAGGGRTRLIVSCNEEVTVWLAAATTQSGQSLEGWQRVENWEFAYSDRERTRMQVYRRKITAGQRVTVEQEAWAGGVLLAPNLELTQRETEVDLSGVPGVVIHHSPASTGRYLGSPGIVRLSDGRYLAKCDEFGPGSNEEQSGVTRVFRSADRGATWSQVARLDGMFWASVFVYRDAVYLLGTTKQYGRVVIRRSDDGGESWTEPKDERTGFISPPGAYHTAPTPVLSHNGRLYKAIEDASLGKNWGERFGAMMFSAPADSDLLDSASWSRSNVIPRDPNWLDGKFNAWLEGNPVATPTGEVLNLLRVQHPRDGWAAVTHLSADSRTLEFDPQRDFIRFPGGAKKFTIRRDEQTGDYWALSNPVLPEHAELEAGDVRNAVSLLRSRDLINWEVRCLVWHHSDVRRHGWQYMDWEIEGDDLIIVSRTAWDDGLGGAERTHDTNLLTFHRLANFRELQPFDSAIKPERLGR